MSQDLRSSFKYLKKLIKDRKVVICRADKDGKLLFLDFKDYNLIMEREFANQFQELTHVDLTTVHHELQQIKDKCDIFLKNFHRAGAIDDSLALCFDAILVIRYVSFPQLIRKACIQFILRTT